MSQFFNTREQTQQWLDEMGVANYTINEDLKVDVHGDVNLSEKYIDKLPVNFNTVTGHFYCHGNQLTTLQGAPQSVGGDFDFNNNKVTLLEGAPQSVGGEFYCGGNQISTLDGAPLSVIGGFYCNDNQLTSLQGAPKTVRGDFDCSDNPLISLEGAPKQVDGEFYSSQFSDQQYRDFCKQREFKLLSEASQAAMSVKSQKNKDKARL